MSDLERIFSIKVSHLEKRIADVKSCLTSYSSEPIRYFIDLINNEIDHCQQRIEKTKQDFINFKITVTGLREDSLPHNLQNQFSAIMNSLSNVTYTFYVSIETIIPFLRRWEHQNVDNELSTWHKILTQYVEELKNLIGTSTPLLSIFGIEFSTIPLQKNEANNIAHIIIIPESQISDLTRWSIASHEIGHVFYDNEKPSIANGVLQPMLEKIKSMNISNEEDERDFRATWGGYWVKELVSDLIGVRTLGPIFAEKALEDAFGPSPSSFVRNKTTHPPWEIRMKLISKAINNLNLEEYSFDSSFQLWEQYKNTYVQEKDDFYAGLITSNDFDDYVIDLICNTVSIKPIETLWKEISQIRPDNVNSFSTIAAVSAYSLERDDEKQKQLKSAIMAKH